jgi:hypothetical protein
MQGFVQEKIGLVCIDLGIESFPAGHNQVGKTAFFRHQLFVPGLVIGMQLKMNIGFFARPGKYGFMVSNYLSFLVLRPYLRIRTRRISGGIYPVVIQRTEKKPFYMKAFLLPEGTKKGKGPFRKHFACGYEKYLFHIPKVHLSLS